MPSKTRLPTGPLAEDAVALPAETIGKDRITPYIEPATGTFAAVVAGYPDAGWPDAIARGYTKAQLTADVRRLQRIALEHAPDWQRSPR